MTAVRPVRVAVAQLFRRRHSCGNHLDIESEIDAREWMIGVDQNFFAFHRGHGDDGREALDKQWVSSCVPSFTPHHAATRPRAWAPLAAALAVA